MIKYYFFNFVLMILNAVLLCYVKFVKYNRSVVSLDGKVPSGLSFALVILILCTIAVHITEFVILKRSRTLTGSYLIVNAILILLPYFLYVVF